MNAILAVVSGEGMVRQLLISFVVIVCALIVYALGRWFFPKLGAAPIVMQVWDGLFILLGALCVINFLLGLIDHPMWRF